MSPDFVSLVPRQASGWRVVVVGGGASGVLMALHLLRESDSQRVILIERTGVTGCGVAYGTRDPAHLLNTRVSNMAAFGDDPDHFLRWLRATTDPEACPFSFVSRALYGRYLAETLANAPGRERLTCLRAEAVSIVRGASGVTVQCADGQSLLADSVVLATGHKLPRPDAGAALSQPWGASDDIDPDGDILLVGTGLTMVDQVLSLLDSGHRGRIEAVSRRGLLPQPHADAAPASIAVEEVPFGAPMSRLLRWLRDRVAQEQACGVDWRSVVDGLRPHVQALWQALDPGARARFLRHAVTRWEVHRHRMPPASADRLNRAMQSGRLVIRRAAFVGAERVSGTEVLARIRSRDDGSEEIRNFRRVIDCRGIRRDPGEHAGPMVHDLLASGQARLDPLRLGIEVDADCRVIRADGLPHAGLFAIGPVSRAAFWEITAVPDIRAQVAILSRSMAKAGQSSHGAGRASAEKEGVS
ncbi:MAG: FAD/NAD(P)-binding protein [Rubellimicrobium sp.]|nr:FAD/NAD(P)-binding protein [Rubellimicrobium sp.]